MSIGGAIRRNVYWTVDFFSGQKVGKHYIDIKRILSDAELGKKAQQEYINNLLNYAVENSEYYKLYKGKTINEFPVVNKNIMLEHYDEIRVDVAVIPEQETEKIHVQRTSGSTGTPFAILQDSRKRYRRIAELKVFGEIAGYKSHEKLGQCRVWTRWQNKSRWQSFKENILAINVSKMDEETVSKLCDTVKKKKVVALLGYANWFDQVVEYLQKHNDIKLPSLKVIFTGSEMLKENTRIKIKELIGCEVAERYSNEEQGILGQQRIKTDDLSYYLNHASYYFEILKFSSDEPAEYGELGRIVITDLFNYAFPMIRYDTGDTGIMEKANAYSNGFPYISKLYGRRLDLIYDTKGKPVQPMSLARVLKNFPGIIQWQFIQKEEKSYLVKFNFSEEKDVSLCVEQLKQILGDDSDISVEYVDEIPILASGKRKPVINEWKKV